MCIRDSDSSGAVVFTASGGIWTQQTFLTDPNAYIGFGKEIAISADGRTALIAAGFTFRRCGNTWLPMPRLQPDDSPSGFGYAVSLSGDGTIALIGAPYATVGNNQKQGAAYFFPIETTPCTEISVYLPLIVQ